MEMTNYEQPETTGIDVLKYLESSDVCISILRLIDDPADIVRVAAVSHFWRQFVIANGLAKQLCLKVVPEFSKFSGVVIGSSGPSEAGTSTSLKLDFYERDHTVYASLLHAIKKSMVFRKDCIQYAISASSTDRYPSESIINTLHPRSRFSVPALYWSSGGQRNPQVPETLIYKLRPGFRLITEIHIHPFQAFWQLQKPIYSAGSVRFKIGHPISANAISNDPVNYPLANVVDDMFVWSYTSPEFPMMQENVLQPFKLPEPVLCLDGYVEVELLGRVQRQESNGLFYIRINHVKVVGRPLSPAFDMKIEEDSGEMQLMYYPSFLGNIMVDDTMVPRMPHRRFPIPLFMLRRQP